MMLSDVYVSKPSIICFCCNLFEVRPFFRLSFPAYLGKALVTGLCNSQFNIVLRSSTATIQLQLIFVTGQQCHSSDSSPSPFFNNSTNFKKKYLSIQTAVFDFMERFVGFKTFFHAHVRTSTRRNHLQQIKFAYKFMLHRLTKKCQII